MPLRDMTLEAGLPRLEFYPVQPYTGAFDGVHLRRTGESCVARIKLFTNGMTGTQLKWHDDLLDCTEALS